MSDELLLKACDTYSANIVSGPQSAMRAAIALIRVEVLEEAAKALYSVARWDQEIFDSLTQTADGSFVYIDEAAAAIRALKENP